MEIGETLYVTDREDFRKWLEENHQIQKRDLVDSVQESRKETIHQLRGGGGRGALFRLDRWHQKSMDAERYALRFSPRRPKSNWTETNKDRARRMIAEGKMTEAGLATLPPDLKI